MSKFPHFANHHNECQNLLHKIELYNDRMTNNDTFAMYNKCVHYIFHKISRICLCHSGLKLYRWEKKKQISCIGV